ncbi:spectrin beta chain, non-erythrocytic 1 isoform X2 [Anopheles stephensi]|uniref:spectrin beta chain, non-erythrocytic 1 isoform X2 n=1 Tax=Anopheles stephensi TaxID=30069 RepID=UPI001658A4C6|nr:spectrin beta chain, non-erythrocytic 1 isoform X2 [Anopheles stephensi]
MSQYRYEYTPYRRSGSNYEPGGYAFQVQQRTNMTQREGIHKFENERIKTLQEERLHIQKKTFTKWMNSFLVKAKMEVDDLFIDLADGIKLLKLLEIISGEKLGKPNSGRMRVHKIENVNKSLAFLHTKVRLESIGAEDIVDHNPRLILGLIWTIILRFQIQEIEIDVDEENESSEKKSAKDALLLWCQRKTHGYQHVHITDFTNSWRSGLGFNALIHSHRPDLFDYNGLMPGRNIENLNHAFDVAERELGIPQLLDAEDIDTARPDEKSILTYVASYYHTFARMKSEQKGGKRIANIVNKLMDADKKKMQFEHLITNLLSWIRAKTVELEKRNFPNSVEGIQGELLAFKEYRTVEKPPKYKERSEIEALYFHVNTLLKSLNQPHYTPQDGKMINDIEKAWQRLENAEHNREVALRDELLRQEKLEQLNFKFEKKSVLREGYLNEMIQVLTDPRYGPALRQVDATVKKHEAISADILARADRFNDLTDMCNELHEENYHGKDRVKKREQEVITKWKELLELLENHKLKLSQMSSLMNLLREIDATMTTIKALQAQFASEDVGPHLLGVEELLQAHSLLELQVTTLGETQRRYVRQGEAFKRGDYKDTSQLDAKLAELAKLYQELQALSAARRARLDEARDFYQFVEDHENEEGWLVDKQRICKAGITAKDLRAVMSLQQKHKALEDEMKVRKPKSNQITEAGKKLIGDKHSRTADVQGKIDSLQEHWKALEDLVDLRKRQLEDASEAYQYYADANETDSWLNEKMALVASDDFGVDEPSAQALLQRHRDLQGELNAYSGDIRNLTHQAEKLIKAGICTLDLSAEPEPVQEMEQEEWVNETRLVPKEVWEDEPVERLEHRTVTENKLLPHVQALYRFEGQNMKVSKGDVMILQNKNNVDWWNVRKLDGTEGFVPANYVKEIEPRPVPCLVRKAEKVKVMQKVKKTILVKEVIQVKRVRPAKVSQMKPLVKRRTRGDDPTAIDSNDSVDKRQKHINDTYDQLQELADRRRALLEDSICLFRFYRECDDFEKWIKDKEKMLRTDDPKGSVETARRQFETFVNDLSASSKRVEAIDSDVEDFVRQGHSQLDKVKARQRQIHQMWEHLNYLKGQKEKSLEGASSVELFYRTCEEAIDWMNEKMTQLDTAEVGPDLKTVQALQRRHENLERELAPVKEKVNRVNLLGNTVKNSYPSERDNVSEKQREIQNLWQKVQEKAKERRSRLENAVGQQIFNNSTKALLSWIAGCNNQLNAEETARDVETAEKLLKKHKDLGEDIQAHDDEFAQLAKLGQQILDRNPALTEDPEMANKIAKLEAERQQLHAAWLAKEKKLQQCIELQVFNREADKIDATTKSHEAYLEYDDLGDSLDDVEAIMKRHIDFENSLGAQDKILKNFSDGADRLIRNNHYDAKYIDERRAQVLARRERVKELAQKRRNALQASKDFQKFSSDVDDLNRWLADKTKIASDESYKDLSNLPRKLQKHKAFERELRANEGQLRMVNKEGESLIKTNNRAGEVNDTLVGINQKWKDLVATSLEKGRRLEQAALQREHNRYIEDSKSKFDELDHALQSKQVGNDLRSCKELMNKHQVLENDIALWEQKVAELVTTGEEMAHEGHFDANNIQNETKKLQLQFAGLKTPARQRRDALDESLRFHKFVFELDTELQWINEHLPAAKSEVIGQNLHQAQSLSKKHKKLEAEIEGHQPMINKTLTSAENLINQNHPERAKVKELCNALEKAWADLQDQSAERSRKLELSLKAQQYLSEAGEIETWLGERNNVLRSSDYGRDRDSATKLLTKHKVIELELDTYSGIVSEMGHTASAMIAAKHPDSKVIGAKQQLIEKMLKSLQRLAGQRQIRLMESLYRHEYFMESAELEQWIKEQEQAVNSEDYGHDYEHLLVLQNKFDDLKHRIEVGAERFNQCENFAKKLIGGDSPYVSEIEKRQELLSNAWQQLLEQLDAREKKLHAAGEIHRFHRDAAEALFRIQDKNAALSSELGKDLNSALALARKHEAFENELVPLEAQLQVLVDDSLRLQAKYPGDNAKAIAAEQENVIQYWNLLKEKSALRNDQLHASCDLQHFLTQVRDLMSWATNLRAALQAEEHVSDAAGATALKIQHDAIYGEIEAREQTFRELNELSDSMVQTGHYAATEVEEKCSALLDERAKLHSAYNKKKILLEQKIDLFCFMRDAKVIDNISSGQEATLSSSDFGQTVEVVQDQVKRHEAFEKLIQTQDEKVAILQDHGRKLVEQNHYDSENIRRRLREIVERRQKVKDLCTLRRQKLANALLYAQFIRDCAEAGAWINEKQKKLEADAHSYTGTSNMEDKVKKLKKLQAFEAEVNANEGRIGEVRDKGEKLIGKKHECAGEIQDELVKLMQSWNVLLNELSSRSKGLKEAQDILEFNTQLDKLEAWIRDKEMMINAGETGRDLEHCNALRRKLDDVDSDMRVDDQRIKNINQLADKLVSQDKVEGKNVQQRRENFNNKWKSLQGALSRYRDLLAGAYEIHVFNRDVDDTAERIAEKMLAMSVDDTGRDLIAVEALKRKQEAIERDMTAVEQKIREHETSAAALADKYPDNAINIVEKLDELKKHWNELQNASVKRAELLKQGYTAHKFTANVKELELWANEMIKRMDSATKPATIADCEAQIQLHNERKAEIDGRDLVFRELKEHGERLVAENRERSVRNDHVEKALRNLEDLNKHLHDSWKGRSRGLKEAHQLQLFKEQADQIVEWLTNKEAFLNNDDLGESFTAVEALIKKHEAFEKLLHSNRIGELERFAEEILAESPFEADVIKQRLYAVISRKDKLLASAESRKQKLQESLQLQQFLRSLYEVEKWTNQKMQIALDENYREPSNLQSKIQKHAAFDAELLANSGRVTAVIEEGESLINAEHYASSLVQEQLDIVESEWQKLSEASREKKERLAEAYDALLFQRSLEDFNNWMDEVEAQLSSEDYGRDLASVHNLLKKHDMLEADVAHHADTCEQIRATDAKMLSSDHFLKDELHESAMLTIKRYHSLHEPTTIRRDNLEDSLQLHQFLRDAEDELLWLNEKEPQAASKDLGSSLTAVQSLQKKHQALEAEILIQEPIISALVQRGQQMIRDNHYAVEQIERQCGQLQNKLVNLRNLTNVRRLRLLDAVESQQFYAEANEAEFWLREKKPIISSQDYGKDEDSVGSLQKKLDGLQRELVAFKPTVEKIEKLASGLQTRGHFDSDKIKNKNDKIQYQFQELNRLAGEREKKLAEMKKLYEFVREIDDLQEWIELQMTTAGSEEYGTDVEHVEQLTAQFESFVSNLNANESRVTGCVAKGEALLNDGNPNKDTIKAKRDETKQLWEELKDLVVARQEALAGARQVHVFDRTADETIAWINEKISSVLSEDYGHDLETIQSLVRTHEAFEAELGAIKEQLESVVNEAQKLADTYPDAKEHIEVKRDETIEVWSELKERTVQRKEKLMQAEQLQAYFDEYRDLMAWINEMLAKITAPDLAKDVAGAEALIGKIREHRTEVEARKEAFEVFNRTGRKLIHDKHFLANEVQERIAVLEQRKRLLDNTIVQRLEMYELNLDTQRFLKEAEDMEGWIISRQMQLKDSKLGDSIAQVEDLLRKHEDFEKTVAAQEEKVLALKRITLLEQRFKKQLEAEQAARIAEKERIERERHEALKQKEVQRITEERRRREPASINGYNDSVSGMGNASGGHLSSPAGAGMMVDRNDSSVGSGAGMMNTSNSTASVGVSHADQTSPVQKSNSFATMLQERLRRGSDSNIKRAESMKMGLKPVKRAPSFTTRRRAQSFRKNQRTGGAGSESDASLLPPVEVQGLLERKHELQSGGKKAPVRSWKPYYTVLCGQLLCFFKDSEDFAMQKAATAPVNILNAKCERAENYTKKKNVFRLVLLDGSEFLFMTTSKESLNEWVNKIAFHAALPPNLQLMSYDESVKQNNSAPDMKSISSAQSPTPDRSDAASSISSRTSSPDSQRRDSRTSLNSAKSGSGSNGSFHTPQTNFLQKQKELREQELQHQRMSSGQQYNNLPSPTAPGPMPEVFGLADKPPIPPRGMPPPVPQRQSSTDNVLNSNNGSVQMRSKPPGSANSPNGSDYDNANIRPYSLQPGAMSSKSPPASQNGGNLTGEDVWLRNSEIRTSDYSVPPLPVTSTPLSTFTPLKPPSGYQHPAQHYHQQSPSSATGTATSTFQPHPNHNMPQQPQKHQIDQFIRREQQTGNSSSARTGNNGTSRTTWHHPMVPTGNGTGNTTNEQQQQLAYHGNGKQSHHHQHHHPHHHGPQGSMGTQPPPPPPPTHMANSSSNTFGNSINLDGFSTGWGQSRFDAARPTSLPPAGANNNNNNNNGGSTSGGPTTTTSLVGQDFGQLVSGGVGRHQSAESSSESEASFIKGGKESSSGKDKKGVFRIFSKKKSKNSS